MSTMYADDATEAPPAAFSKAAALREALKELEANGRAEMPAILAYLHQRYPGLPRDTFTARDVVQARSQLRKRSGLPPARVRNRPKPTLAPKPALRPTSVLPGAVNARPGAADTLAFMQKVKALRDELGADVLKAMVDLLA